MPGSRNRRPPPPTAAPPPTAGAYPEPVTTSTIERKPRTTKRTVLSWLPYGIMALLIIAAAITSIGFGQSWWTQSKPAASAQQEFDGQSLFTQAGVDYSGKRGLVKVSLSAGRPTASQLGLPNSGTRTISYVVPVTIAVSGSGQPIREQFADQLKITTESGRVSRVYFLDDHSYNEMHQHALDLIQATGTTADQAAFDAQLAASRVASADKKYAATSATTRDGVRVDIHLAGTPSTANLTIALSPE